MTKQKNYLNAHSGALTFLLAIGANLAFQFLAGIVLTVLMLIEGASNIDFYASAVMMALIQVIFTGSVLLMLKVKKTRLLYTPLSKPSKARNAGVYINILIGIVCVAVSLFCFFGLASVFDYLLYKIGYNTDSGAFLMTDTTQIIIMMILTVVLAPIGEELLFRGALLSGLRRKFGIIPCILLNGLAFSLMHMNPVQTVYQFCLGCAIAYITIQSHSLIPAILMHAANNFIAMMLEIVPSFNSFAERLIIILTPNLTVTIIFVIGSLIAGIAIIWLLGILAKKINIKFSGAGDYGEHKKQDEYPQAEPAQVNYSYNPYAGQPTGYGAYNPPQQQWYGGFVPPQQPTYGNFVPPQQQTNCENSVSPHQQQQTNGDNNITSQEQANVGNSVPPQLQPYQSFIPPQQAGTPNNYGYQYPPYGYGQGMNQYETYYRQKALLKKREGLFGKSSFGIYYGLSIGICAIMWLLTFGMGFLTL